MNLRYEEDLRASGRRVILTSEPNPLWLQRAVQRQEALDAMRAERLAARTGRFHQRIVWRVRTALAGI